MQLEDEDDLDAAFRDVDAAIRKADRDLARARLAGGLDEILGLLDRGAAIAAPGDELETAVRQALAVAGRFAGAGNYRDGMGTVVAVLRALLADADEATRAAALEETLGGGGGLLERPIPYLEAFVASLAPRLTRMSRRQLWDWLANGSGVVFLGERIAWSGTHPGTGRPARDGFLVHGASGRAIGFRTFSAWLEKFAGQQASH